MQHGEMILRTSQTSPYGRKVRMCADVLGLADELTILHADTRDPDDPLRIDNPLGKMPVLIIDDTHRLFDSRVIIEYLDSIATKPSLIPTTGLARYNTLTAAALADGVTDAALLIVYERRFRKPAQVSEHWLLHQLGKIRRALDFITANESRYEAVDVASISLACAVSYLDWRKPYDWRSRHPSLAVWHQQFVERVPAYKHTDAYTESLV